MRPKIMFLIIAFLSQYVADFSFLYLVSRGTPPIVSGLVDYMYLFSYFLMSVALIQLRTTFNERANGVK